MKLLKATKRDSFGPIWINPDHIVFIQRITHGPTAYTYIKLTFDKYTEVDETPEMLMDKEYCSQNLLEFK